jgi:hypothetical protein
MLQHTPWAYDAVRVFWAAVAVYGGSVALGLRLFDAMMLPGLPGPKGAVGE